MQSSHFVLLFFFLARLCPHCNKTVYRTDGCASMTCGRDASDKGGGNRQVRYCWCCSCCCSLLLVLLLLLDDDVCFFSTPYFLEHAVCCGCFVCFVQDGCGKGFNWNKAEPYKRGDDQAHLPKVGFVLRSACLDDDDVVCLFRS